jgi:hypothetical protein
VRLAPERPEGELGVAFPAIVVHDDAELVAVYQAPGSIAKARHAEKAGPHGRVILSVGDEYSDLVWHRWRRLFLRRPAEEYAISLFWDSETDALRFWYIDLVTPLRRTAIGFDWVDHGIDIVVEPDMRTWSWKDADELEWYVAHGRYSIAEAERIRAVGEEAVARLRSERDHFERWVEWRPDPAWPIPTLPHGWDAP